MVNIIEEFQSSVEGNTNFQSGVMELMGNDGSQLTFNAGNGDDNSVLITLLTAEGETTFNEAWESWAGILIPGGIPLELFQEE